MSSNLKVKRWSVSNENIKYVQDYKMQYDTGDDSTALRMILKEHADYKKHLFDLNYITEALKEDIISNVSQFISKNLLEEIKRIRLGTNNTDRNTQILIELVQGWMILSKVEAISSSEKYKPDFLKFAETVVSNRIIHQKQKRDEKLNKKGD